MLRIAVCDDEKLHRELLTDAITAFSIHNDMEFSVVQISVAEELLSRNLDYDVLFLDILLNDGVNGIEVGHQLREHGYDGIIIIVTLMDEYLIDGYSIEAFRYIMKPITQEKIDEALRGVLKKYSKDNLKIQVRCLDGECFLDVNEIIMIESYHRGRKIYLEDRIAETRETLDELCKKLPQDQFAYAQKSYIVNFKHLMSENRSIITMRNKTKIVISRARTNDFMRSLQTYIKSLGGR